MDTTYRIPHAVATVIGTFAVAYQSAVVWEAYETASLVTKLGIPLATISAALLPALAEAAWTGKERIKACLLALPVVALVAFVLPSGVSRLGEPQEARKAAAAMSASDTAKLTKDLATADKLVAEAQAWVATECRTGVGKKCDGVTYTLRQRQAYQEKLASQIKPPVVEPWLPSWHPATLPIGLELAIWGCFFFAFGPLARRSSDAVQALTFERDLTPVEIAEIKRIQKLTPENVTALKSKGMKQHEIAAHFGLNQGRISEMMAGKREAITLH